MKGERRSECVSIEPYNITQDKQPVELTCRRVWYILEARWSDFAPSQAKGSHSYGHVEYRTLTGQSSEEISPLPQ